MKSVSTTFPQVNADWILATSEWSQDLSLPGPRKSGYTPGPIPGTLYYEDTIDLSAFVVQDKTFFPNNVEVIEPGLNQMGPDAAAYNNQAALILMDVVTSAPLDANTTIDNLVNGIYPGGSRSPIDMQFIMFGRVQVFATNSSASYPGLITPISSQNFGAGLPTAADKLFCYRFVYPQNMAVNLATLRTVETTLTFVGVAETESELARIYRLRQSYEQNQ